VVEEKKENLLVQSLEKKQRGGRKSSKGGAWIWLPADRSTRCDDDVEVERAPPFEALQELRLRELTSKL
jgi:hypothetical protein